MHVKSEHFPTECKYSSVVQPACYCHRCCHKKTKNPQQRRMKSLAAVKIRLCRAQYPSAAAFWKVLVSVFFNKNIYYININVTCKGNTALDAATVVVLCTCQHSSRPWIRMRLVVLHVDGLRCAKVGLSDYRPTYSKKCLHCLKAALVFGRRTTYSVPGMPQFAAHQLKLLSGRCAESHPAKQPSTIKNARKEFTIH